MLTIDVHAHLIPGTPSQEALARIVAREGFNKVTPPMEWSPEIAMDFMDRHDIQMQLLSSLGEMTAPAATAMNDIGAQVVAMYPGRFGLLASLPMAEPDAALREVHRAYDELGADGIVLVTNYEGAYFGDPRFEPVFAELDRRHASVFVHPVAPSGFSELSLGRPGPLIEFPMDTARTVVDAVFAGLFLRHPGIRMILAHAGGVLPSLADRIVNLGVQPWVANPLGLTSGQLRDQLSSLYFDTALATTAATMVPVVELAGVDHIVFGTDFPPGGDDVAGAYLATLLSGQPLSAQDIETLNETVAGLFPRAAARIIA
ncbi:amidohydrolase family protein [Mycolicibacterium sp. HS_4_1]